MPHPAIVERFPRLRARFGLEGAEAVIGNEPSPVAKYMETADILLLVVGLGALALGAELLVRGAARLAAALGISPLVIGLTVVAFGTGAPELAVGLQAVAAGQADVLVGNVVGSNIFNVLFILGLSALLVPLVVAQRLVKLDVPIMIGASVLILVLALDGVLGRFDGVLLFAGIVAYTVFAIRESVKEEPDIGEQYATRYGRVSAAQRWRRVADVAFIVLGLALLVVGARWLVDSAVSLARALGVTELLIALTVVAAGTSLPEVATSVVAALRGQRDIAVGNVVGSNILNVLGIAGICALLSRDGIPVARGVITFDMPVMIAAAIACLPILFTGHLIARWEGALFLGYYVAYTAYLALASLEHHALPQFSRAMLGYVVPLTLVTVVVVYLRSAPRSRRTGDDGRQDNTRRPGQHGA